MEKNFLPSATSNLNFTVILHNIGNVIRNPIESLNFRFIDIRVYTVYTHGSLFSPLAFSITTEFMITSYKNIQDDFFPIEEYPWWFAELCRQCILLSTNTYNRQTAQGEKKPKRSQNIAEVKDYTHFVDTPSSYKVTTMLRQQKFQHAG